MVLGAHLADSLHLTVNRLLQAMVDRLAKAADGLDGRRIRKGIFAAAASDIETAKNLNKLTCAQIEAAYRHALKSQREVEQ